MAFVNSRTNYPDIPDSSSLKVLDRLIKNLISSRLQSQIYMENLVDTFCLEYRTNSFLMLKNKCEKNALQSHYYVNL